MEEQNYPAEEVQRQAKPMAIDLTPRPGQSSAEVKAWMDSMRPSTKSNMLARSYAREIYKTKPDRHSDPAAEAAWYAALTEFQRKVLKAAAQQRNADPKVREAEKKRRAADPQYQRQLKRKRKDYGDRIEAEEGRSVREYRRGAKPTQEQTQDESNARNETMRARIRDELAADRNPFDPDSLDNVKASFDAVARLQMKYLICAKLLDPGVFDTANDPEAAGWAKQSGISAAELNKLIDSAIEALRTAKAISRRGSKIYLHRDLVRKREARSMAGNKFYGMF